MSVHKINNNEAKVKDALDIWADWMKKDRHDSSLGYGKCTGFYTEGNTSSWQDFAHKVDTNMAVSVQAIYEGLKQHQQSAINHFHLSELWKHQRHKIEDAYSEALTAIELALRRRGLL